MQYYIYVLENKILISNGEKKLPTKIVTNGNITTLYLQEEIIGYNLFSVATEEFKKGLIFIKDEKLEEVIFSMLGKKIEIDYGSHFLVGKVLECENHPDSDHLHICKVDIKTEILQIVCGAKNVAAGQLVVVATVGAMMPDGTLISSGVLRNIPSYGMICSGFELNLDGYQKGQGILILDNSYSIGEKYFK